MTRRKWTGLAAVLFGALMITGIVSSGTTPDTGAGAVERYAEHWADTGHQDRASFGSILLTYACVALVAFAAGLRALLGGFEGALRTVVVASGTAAAGALAAGAALVNGAGLAGAESDYAATGGEALLVEAIGYYTVSSSMMLMAAMALAFALANRTARVVPQWTIVLAGLLALVGLGSIFTAWIGFMLVPVWAIVIGVCLLVLRGSEEQVEAAPAL